MLVSATIGTNVGSHPAEMVRDTPESPLSRKSNPQPSYVQDMTIPAEILKSLRIPRCRIVVVSADIDKFIRVSSIEMVEETRNIRRARYTPTFSLSRSNNYSHHGDDMRRRKRNEV